MSERCEVCEGPVAARCAGLDVPSLSFCAECARDHERTCDDVKKGFAMIHWIER